MHDLKARHAKGYNKMTYGAWLTHFDAPRRPFYGLVGMVGSSFHRRASGMLELNSQPTSVQSLYAWFRDNKLFVNRRYQRKLVWTLDEKQRLIESILNKFPIPAIIVAEREESPGTYEIIDGLQRLHAIVSFIETAFPTLEDEVFALKHYPSAQSRADEGRFIPQEGNALSQKDVSTFLDYTFALSIMRNASEAEVNDVFSRINTYGHRLSDQERRQAGVRNEFSDMVRRIACTVRGDVSSDVLGLEDMPSISIDLPMSKHGYEVQADEVFWVVEGVLRSTDLRDSMDEQCIADIAACIVGGTIIERSKDALDLIFSDSVEGDRVLDAVDVYGATKFEEEFKYCVDEVLRICAGGGKKDKLRSILFTKNTTNPFPNVFTTVMIAMHEVVVQGTQRATDYAAIKKALTDLDNHIITTRRSTNPVERRKNIDVVKGIVSQYYVADATVHKEIYASHSTTDIDASIRRSEVELPNFELKQGILLLDGKRRIDDGVREKVLKTICAIANNGAGCSGKIIVGVTDKDADAQRIKEMFAIEPKKVGRRWIVGVDREAKALGISIEDYYAKWRNWIKDSSLSDELKASVLSSMDYSSYFGYGLLVISIPPQRDLSYLDGVPYWRSGDNTVEAKAAREIAMLAKRF
ncbi:MAG TPA: DUF262 domain-containing protein [Luteibacter sp.]|uniref:GmrSD restriction endonuclease domain-containing protein n=1 Tax=Luteibacter sp. TaxID=1886636 RepID=UPI002C0A5BB4|nr:DUF262 domain-containing protein [Luteibacter sp.]HVI54520.1 DUF262 domain-containing protein [Luteibacter sp.]